ncbi:MAG: S9 family peptidase [Bacteroidetes bacterium]|nr:S9 family peptidase [Bacteroidota bacterium]
MIRILFYLLMSVCSTYSIAQTQITLEDIFQNNTYTPKSIYELRSMQDGLHYTVNEGGRVIGKYAYSSGNREGEIFNVNSFDLINRFYSYQLNNNESLLLLAAESYSRYRRATLDNNFIYTLKSGTIQQLSETGLQMYAHFSPVENKVAYVIDNDIYFKDLDSDKEIRITSDGLKNHIINGGSDWVYEEEFKLVRAFEWSPDGKKIAYYRFDESDVTEYTLQKFEGKLYPENIVYKYPKVGEVNSRVEIYIYDLETNTTVKVKTGSPEYIPRIKWIDADYLSVIILNRLQNQMYLLKVNALTGGSEMLLFEEAAKYIFINDDLTFLSEEKGFIWRSEKDGYSHLYHFDMKGNLITQITKGEWEVMELLGYDEKLQTLYYISTEKSPLYKNVYSIGLNGKNNKLISTANGNNTIKFSKGFNYYISYYSNFATPVKITLHDKSGKQIRVLEDNATLKNLMTSAEINAPEFFSFATSENIALNGWMIKPHDFDSTKKYPVFMFVYGGPGYQHAADEWFVRSGGNYAWFQMLAQQGYIIAGVDGRGSGGRGRDFRQITYQNLGKYETIDQIEAAKWLGTQSYVDAKRIGIFGSSYGGYLSLLCLEKGRDIFKTAIAVAPVTNWKYYDDVYTERYMGTLESNPGGYDANSPIFYTDLIQGNLLLIHGAADDNVHWQNTAELISALVASNKQFDLMIYPDKNHSLSGGNTKYHEYKLITDFILENL